jgi:predicted nucleic acid-binding protein
VGAVSRRGILDTSVLIADDVVPIPGELAISIVSIAELQFGVLVGKTPEAQALRLARLSAVQRRFDPLPVDEAVADTYARLAAAVVRAGRQPRARTMDLLVAATAAAHSAAVYTRNARDFAGLEDLVEVVPI